MRPLFRDFASKCSSRGKPSHGDLTEYDLIGRSETALAPSPIDRGRQNQVAVCQTRAVPILRLDCRFSPPPPPPPTL